MFMYYLHLIDDGDIGRNRLGRNWRSPISERMIGRTGNSMDPHARYRDHGWNDYC
ncbi:hypothetical protein RAD15_33100 [Bradyrhizobium sp. 14AA]